MGKIFVTERPIYLSSDMHLQGQSKLEYFKIDIQRISYSDSTLYILMSCKAVTRKWRDVFVNGVDPGWIPTKRGGSGATGNLQKGYGRQTCLAMSDDATAKVSRRFFLSSERSPLYS